MLFDSRTSILLFLINLCYSKETLFCSPGPHSNIFCSTIKFWSMLFVRSVVSSSQVFLKAFHSKVLSPVLCSGRLLRFLASARCSSTMFLTAKTDTHHLSGIRYGRQILANNLRTKKQGSRSREKRETLVSVLLPNSENPNRMARRLNPAKPFQ